MEFVEEYFTNEGYKEYKDYPHFLDRATFIKDSLQPEGIIVLGGAIGYTNKYLDVFGINNLNLDTSIYCYNNKVCENFFIDATKVKYNNYDWIVSWNVLDCLDDSVVNTVCSLLNSFKGNQLHVTCCDHQTPQSASYKGDGYFIQSHEYWIEKLPTANLVCYDCKKVIQGTVVKVPLCWGLVTD